MKRFLAIGALLCAATAANASITVLINGSVGPDGDNHYTYSYRIEQTAGDEIRTNYYIALFAFNGLVTTAGHLPTGPLDWTPTFNLVGANTPSVRFTYVGASPITANTVSPFFIESTVGPDVSPNIPFVGPNWSSQNTQNNGSGTTYGPDQESVPEPATM